MNIIIKGKSKSISMEEFKSLIYATDCILRSHNFDAKDLTIYLRKKIKGYEDTCIGTARNISEGIAEITIRYDLDYNKMITTIIHEMIHIYVFSRKDISGEEKITSTLTSKIKKDVQSIANILVKNKYQRAAYIAHCKISYKPKQKESDYYDQSQFNPTGIKSEGLKYRSKRRSI